ncbi:MAG: 50S ribosomal protein L17 [SAR202 cluster bacterium]|nr:50S ribosomal protein L17 [Chloroflexota bacterium]MDP6420721.1 50S ribosomal protein L17 [SAR202 cluster bacterium]HAL48610.1 50S ribosomal protein L17 [Dehalococcoidia bacterium]MDP6663762.1 50S ribosomal protein L17 [SAR202 cluster bacterium]MDP6798573.1 50S ribosomal protein L17 [SAR202 cluster bacterium]
MRHRLSRRKLNRPTAHRMLMLRGMVTALINNETMRTTEAKAKEVRRLTEKMVTLGKKGSLHHRRQAASMLMDDDAVRKLFAELAERYAERNGGYTRMYKLGPRQGDAADMAIIELVA